MKVRVIMVFDVFASLLLSMPPGADGSVAFMHYVIALSRAERAVEGRFKLADTVFVMTSSGGWDFTSCIRLRSALEWVDGFRLSVPHLRL